MQSNSYLGCPVVLGAKKTMRQPECPYLLFTLALGKMAAECTRQVEAGKASNRGNSILAKGTEQSDLGYGE